MSEVMPGVAPTISVAMSYGEHVESLDIDIAGIVNYLRARGVSDREIESLTIELSDAPNTNNRGLDTLAEYDTDTDTIRVLALREMRLMSRVAILGHTAVVTADLNKTLVHEIEHKVAVDNVELQKEVWRYLKKQRRLGYAKAVHYLFASVMSGSVKSRILDEYRWKVYENDPEEIYVEAIAQASDEKFITVSPKYVDFQTLESVECQLGVLEVIRSRYDDESVPDGSLHGVTRAEIERATQTLQNVRNVLREIPDPLRVRL